jgi:hypothetical protein
MRKIRHMPVSGVIAASSVSKNIPSLANTDMPI